MRFLFTQAKRSLSFGRAAAAIHAVLAMLDAAFSQGYRRLASDQSIAKSSVWAVRCMSQMIDAWRAEAA